MTLFEELLGRLARMLDAAGIPYMVIGGQAVLIHGEPRFTMDVDITLGVGVESIGAVLETLEANALRALPADPAAFVRQTHVLPVQNSHSTQRVDVIFSDTPYEKAAIGRGIQKSIAGTSVRFIAAEDLLIHKLVAGRPRDVEDAQGVWERNKKTLDTGYIEKWLKQFAMLEGLTRLPADWKQIRSR